MTTKKGRQLFGGRKVHHQRKSWLRVWEKSPRLTLVWGPWMVNPALDLSRSTTSSSSTNSSSTGSSNVIMLIVRHQWMFWDNSSKASVWRWCSQDAVAWKHSTCTTHHWWNTSAAQIEQTLSCLSPCLTNLRRCGGALTHNNSRRVSIGDTVKHYF